MSQSEKAGYFRALKDAGVQFDKHYREYTTAELKAAYAKLVEADPELAAPRPAPRPAAPKRPDLSIPVRPRDPEEMAGARLNTKAEDEPIRVDDQGRIWYQEEVVKAGYAKPRGRRVLKYTSSGTKTQTVQNGEYLESFEVAGDGPKVAGEIKITLPSYQAGIYKDPRFPFKIHTYNGNRGFSFFDVAQYYGGQDLVPLSIKKVYVANVLCYDIRTTIRTIQSEYRQLQLAGKV